MDGSEPVDPTLIYSLLMGCNIQDKPEINQVIIERFGYDYKNPPGKATVGDMRNISEYLREKLYPFLSEDESQEKIGEAIVKGALKTPLGMVRKAVAKVLGPEKATEEFIKNFKETLPFIEVELEEVRKGYMRYRIKGLDNPPALMRGLLKTIFTTAGGGHATVSSQVINFEEVVYECRWE